ncbi:hypothetical protein BD289DRAFT_132785 [Coniella lustricola]|uniref:TPX2 C-terminal domain-containing protein n=1 Tax=Coniella lustricola TaxID=2025994 RepID=A0A2T2ZVY7_9PEZI|nr:hypothetical protein BD289DRAFT_132785 [Coniella lustricola]
MINDANRSLQVDAVRGHDLVQAARRLDPSEDVFERHQKKHFQWVLSLSAPAAPGLDQSANKGAEGHKQHFGCNLLVCSKPPGREHQPPGDPDDKYLLLATAIDLQSSPSSAAHGEFTAHKFQVHSADTLRLNLDMASGQDLETPMTAASSAYRPSPLSANSAQWSTAVEPADDSDNTLTREPCGKVKDHLSSLDAAFQHEDQFDDNTEAMTKAASQISLSDDKDGQDQSHGKEHQEAAAAPAADASPAVEANPGSVKKPAAASLRKVARPASLAPPRPIQKASKPPTVPTFELPGERVARELKEKKAARLSMQVDPHKMAEASPPQRTRSVRSSKPPTVPNFELPGERYSRMKKERLEQKLKEEEEEARRRRQFKARPWPASASPTVRSTFTSRQRHSTGGPLEACSPQPPTAVESPPRAMAAKRQSMTMTASAVRAVSTASASTAASAAARGRGSSIESSRVSTRATSSSAGSVMSGKKHGAVPTRTGPAGKPAALEEHDRKEAIKLARQKYAEMSRMKATQGRTRREQQQQQQQQQSVSTDQTEEHVPVASGSS